jgi:hypothetical protein
MSFVVANASKFLGSAEVLSVLLAGLLHDVDHPGLNNNFQVLFVTNFSHHSVSDELLVDKYGLTLGSDVQ